MRATSTSIRVLFVSTSLDTGGAQRFTSNLINNLDPSAFTPVLCVFRPEIGYPLREDIARHAFSYNRRPWQILPTILRLRKLIQSERPDVILSNIAATNLLTGLALTKLRDRPAWIARIGNDPLRHDGSLRRLLARRTYPRADRIVANSRGLAGAISEFYPCTSGKIDVLATPTDFDALERRADEPPQITHRDGSPLLIAVGRLYRQKRFDVMLRALAEVRRHAPATLWICGDGPERAELEALKDRLGLGESVRFLGFCRNPFALMRQADCFVLTSDHEGLPNVLIEAQGLGLPAVSTDCPYGPSEILGNGRTGHLVPLNDPAATARAILRVILGETGHGAMADEARQTARERFRVDSLVGAWERLITTVARADSD